MDYHIVGGGYLHVRTSFTGLLTVGRLAVTPGVAMLMEARSGHKRNLIQLVFVKSYQYDWEGKSMKLKIQRHHQKQLTRTLIVCL